MIDFGLNKIRHLLYGNCFISWINKSWKVIKTWSGKNLSLLAFSQSTRPYHSAVRSRLLRRNPSQWTPDKRSHPRYIKLFSHHFHMTSKKTEYFRTKLPTLERKSTETFNSEHDKNLHNRVEFIQPRHAVEPYLIRIFMTSIEGRS